MAVSVTAARAKEAMQKRLQVAEERLATVNRELSVQGLVDAKIRLAQADYYALELQVGPTVAYV